MYSMGKSDETSRRRELAVNIHFDVDRILLTIASRRFPHEIIWLGGAPGAGKGVCFCARRSFCIDTTCVPLGTNTPFIIETRGLSSTPIIMSDLLDQFPEIKNSGKLVSDIIVFELVLETLLEPRYRRGVIVDGFPRTETQVKQ